jgi:hypothetical protein
MARKEMVDKYCVPRIRILGIVPGILAYPSYAVPGRPMVSRVREIRMHGLKGGLGNGAV